VDERREVSRNSICANHGGGVRRSQLFRKPALGAENSAIDDAQPDQGVATGDAETNSLQEQVHLKAQQPISNKQKGDTEGSNGQCDEERKEQIGSPGYEEHVDRRPSHAPEQRASEERQTSGENQLNSNHAESCEDSASRCSDNVSALRI
jgi:hypothetical protein